jgi:Porin subfamily
MSSLKTTALGLLASVAALSTASAADLPSKKKAAPVEYVKVCSTYGEGFFYVPGSQSCLRISGQVRADAMIGHKFVRADNLSWFSVRGQVNLDHRTQTEYGLLRTYIRYEMTKASGAPTSADLALAFVQFGGLTAGRVQSFYDFYANELNFGTLRGSDQKINAFAYTVNLGAATATLAVEDGTERRTPGITYAGHAMPDVVANVRVDQAWGAVQLSGAVHQTRFATIAGGDTDYGYAVQLGTKLNVPMVAENDALYLQVAYAHGAMNYLGYNAASSIRGLPIGLSDFDQAGASQSASKGFNVLAAFQHNWTPSFNSTFFGTFSDIKAKVAGVSANFREYQVGANLVWTPVKGLAIGPEVQYNFYDAKGGASFRETIGMFRVQRDF